MPSAMAQHTAPPTPADARSPPPPEPGPCGPASADVGTSRRVLPDRNVTDATIERAYVDFIMYCNPAVPSTADTSTLAATFRSPPKTDGNTFSTFALFRLVGELETRQIKSWAELVLKLGVKPPDQDRKQSSQKIQQYAVRLKRWMHSMHIDAFFNYLAGIHHPYWMHIPLCTTPISTLARDGVPAEDDMALRALLPHIRPRRGRKRADDDESRRSPPGTPAFLGARAAQMDSPGPWSAHLDGSASQPHFLPGPAQPLVQDHARSAITPPMSAPFWHENEPRSAVTGSPPKVARRRYGIKAVSSAWKSGLATGKTRGRPPTVTRAPIHNQFSAFHAELGTSSNPQAADLSNSSTSSSPYQPNPPPMTNQSPQPNIEPPLPLQLGVPGPPESPPPSATISTEPSVGAKPSRPTISLHVPQHPSGPVRLATPPPQPLPQATHLPETPPHTSTPLVDGANALRHNLPPRASSLDSVASVGRSSTGSTGSPVDFIASRERRGHFEVSNVRSRSLALDFRVDNDDRTNYDKLYGAVSPEVMRATWVDGEGKPSEPCSESEGRALIANIISTLRARTTCKESFLISLSTWAGGQFLMTPSRLRVARMEETATHIRYKCLWTYQFGSVKGRFLILQNVAKSQWQDSSTDTTSSAGTDGRRGGEEEVGELTFITNEEDDLATHLTRSAVSTGSTSSPAPSAENVGQRPAESAAYWKAKYEKLLAEVKEKERELEAMQRTAEEMQRTAEETRKKVMAVLEGRMT